jgi:hypothetical protein
MVPDLPDCIKQGMDAADLVSSRESIFGSGEIIKQSKFFKFPINLLFCILSLLKIGLALILTN